MQDGRVHKARASNALCLLFFSISHGTKAGGQTEQWQGMVLGTFGGSLGAFCPHPCGAVTSLHQVHPLWALFLDSVTLAEVCMSR